MTSANHPFADLSKASVAQLDLLLNQHGRSQLLRRTLWLIVLLVLIFIVWAVTAQINELARARGEIQPSGYVQLLQSQTGGAIDKLLVKEGDSVKAGQIVAQFQASDLLKRKTQNTIKLNALAIDRERMLAILENRQPDFSAYLTQYPRLVAQAQSSYREQIATRDAAMNSKRSEGGQQALLLEGAVRDRKLIESQIAEAKERVRRLEEGVQKGVVTQLTLSEARQQVTSLQERLSDVSARAGGLNSTMGGVGADVLRLKSDFNQQLSLELSKVTEQYREIEAEIKALEENQNSVVIRSPVDGIVTNLPQTQLGSVLQPGGVVAEVVPTGQGVFMEAAVAPKDIGFVKVGQAVTVKVDSFDSARFGAIKGTVKRVSPTSTKAPQNGAPFYKVEIALATPYVGSPAHQLVPGMTAEADIATGRKSVMQFLLKPVFTAADTAFHER
ncbi:HlyD family type I secretion periplasmic adaptor subunit [Chitinibacter fontanus]|uniref:Membrane fusion protein (MFP) family protein n=1 Tax=Chitinibacter fontanus TaxID=1737446 RepID=A0A7D5VC21_9NEIS|nr:HlyD family type I secretion periplasmic adaptor subunit [Chitinibacter fontanus]QLI82680.1 HlyD family type I secretion periplasmic adaptor subunit [Chitinibacter fontanus]